MNFYYVFIIQGNELKFVSLGDFEELDDELDNKVR